MGVVYLGWGQCIKSHCIRSKNINPMHFPIPMPFYFHTMVSRMKFITSFSMYIQSYLPLFIISQDRKTYCITAGCNTIIQWINELYVCVKHTRTVLDLFCILSDTAYTHIMYLPLCWLSYSKYTNILYLTSEFIVLQ